MNNILFEKSSNDKNHSKRIKPIYKVVFFISIIALIIFSFSQINFSLHTKGKTIFYNNIQKLFWFKNNDPDFPSHTILNNSLNYLWITIRITLCGTLFGFLVAFFTSFISSEKIVNKFLAFFNRLVILFLRSFPIIIFIQATQVAMEREFAAFAIIFWFSWIWSNKYLVNIINNTNFDGYQHWIKMGYNRSYSFKKQILSRSKNKYISIFLYSLESNIRWSTILSTMGVIGIGFFINNNIKNHFEFVGIPLSLLFSTLIFLEILSVIINKYLLVVKSQTKKTFNYKKTINYLLLSTILVISIYQLIIIDYENISFKNFFNFFNKNLKTMDLDLWTTSNQNRNSWLLILQLGYQTIAALTLAITYAITTALLSSEKRNKIYIWLPIKLINNFIKIIPLLILFYLFNPVFISPIGLGVILIGISTGAILSNKLVGSINNIDKKYIYEYQKMGFSRFQITRKLIFPTIIKDLKSLSFLEGESIFRTSIILGTIGLSAIGSDVYIFEYRSKMPEFASHVWAITITIFVFNVVPIIYNNIRSWKIWTK